MNDKDKEYAEKMKQIIKKYGHDEEVCHIWADDLLCEILKELGFKETVEEYDKVPKWYA